MTEKKLNKFTWQHEGAIISSFILGLCPFSASLPSKVPLYVCLYTRKPNLNGTIFNIPFLCKKTKASKEIFRKFWFTIVYICISAFYRKLCAEYKSFSSCCLKVTWSIIIWSFINYVMLQFYTYLLIGNCAKKGSPALI